MAETIRNTSLVVVDTDSHAHEPDTFIMKRSDGKLVPIPGMEGEERGSVSTGSEYSFSQTGNQVLEPIFNPPKEGALDFVPALLPSQITGTLVGFHKTNIELREDNGADPVMLAEMVMTQLYDVKTRLPVPLVVFFPFTLNAFSVSKPPTIPDSPSVKK